MSSAQQQQQPSSAVQIDYIASDLDGTLLDGDHRFSPLTRRTIKRILTQVKPGSTTLVLATGRNYYDVKKLCNQLIMYVNYTQEGEEAQPGEVASPPASPSGVLPDLDQLRYKDFYVIASNGAVAKNALTEEVLYDRSIDPKLVEALYRFLPSDETEINTNVYQYDDWLARLDWPEMEQYHQESGLRYVFCPDGPPAAASMADAEALRRTLRERDPAQAPKRVSPQPCIPEGNYHGVSKVFFLGEPEKLASLKQRLIREFGEGTFSITNSALQCLDVMAANVNKGTALSYLLNRIEQEKEAAPGGDAKTATPPLARAVTFGDGLNDAEMLLEAGQGFVMGNCNPELPKVCPALPVIGKHTDDAVAKKLIELFHMEDEH